MPLHVLTDPDTGARRALINGAAWAQADHEPQDVRVDPDRLARLAELHGDVACAYLHGHRTLDTELLKLAGAVLAWLEKLAEEAAR